MSKYPICRSSLKLALVVLLGSLEGFAQVPIHAEPNPDEVPAVEPEQPDLETEAPRAPDPAAASASRVRWSEPADLPEDEPEARHKSAKKPKPWMLYLALTHERFTGDDFDDSQVLVSAMPGYSAAIVAIPELESGTGFTLGLGYGSYPEQIGSVGFWTGLFYSVKWMSSVSTHTPSAPEGVLHDLDIPLRIGYRVTHELLPYAQVSYGFGFLGMTGIHGYLDGSGAVIFDQESSLFMGRSFDFGIGSLFRLTETLSVDAFVSYGALFVTSVDDYELDDSLNAGVLTLSLGPTMFF